ncbi:hypothetical protein MMC29_006049 [Sticta canariensis]|nr:hypothetical protein [Sticta canariensis]
MYRPSNSVPNLGDDTSQASNATSAAHVAFSEGLPLFEDSGTTRPLHEEPVNLDLSTSQCFTPKFDLKSRLSAYIEALISKRRPGQGDLITALSGLRRKLRSSYLLYNLDGYETTAKIFAFAIVILVAYPEWQDWMAEAIETVFEMGDNTKAVAYEAAFSKLRRCVAIMLETLRLHGFIVLLPKTTGFHSQILALHQNSYNLPPNTSVNINVQALHTNPECGVSMR